MFRGFPIALPQVKVGHTSKNLFSKVVKQNGYYIHKFWKQ